jgi:hypothetical protein
LKKIITIITRVAQRGVGGVLVGCSPSEGKVFSKNIKGGPKEKL